MRALPDPVLALGLGQGVEVDEDVPFRVVGDVLIERRASPQSANVGAVAPEVVEELTSTADVGDSRVGIEDLAHVAL